MNSQVWINGTSLGTRPYGYTSFEYDLTPYVTFGAQQRHRGPGQQQPAEQPLVFGQRHLSQRLADQARSRARPLRRRVRLDAVGLARRRPQCRSAPTCRTSRRAAASATVTATMLGAERRDRDVRRQRRHRGRRQRDRQGHPEPDRGVAAALVDGLAQPLSGQVDVKVGGAIVDTYVTPLGFRTARSTPRRASHSTGRT